MATSNTINNNYAWTMQPIPQTTTFSNNATSGFGIANTPNAVPDFNINNNSGFFNNLKQGAAALKQSIGNGINTIGSWFTGGPTSNATTIQNMYTPSYYTDPTTLNRTPVYDFNNSDAGSLTLLGALDREAQYQAALQADPTLNQQTVEVPASASFQANTDNAGLFGWDQNTWNNINTAFNIANLGWNMYAGWQGLQNAKDALAEQSMMNAYNRSLSTFNTNTQIEQANQSLKDRLYARQKYQTGSTEGAEELYKERELQKFRG